MSTPTAPTARNQRMILLAAFAASGMAALIYEVVWTRALALIMGSTTHAVSTMLATFMAGLALGAVWGGRYADRGRPLVRAFALCELGIGLAGILSVPFIYKLPGAYLYLYRALHLHPALFYAGQALLCALIMLPPTLLMGATFPLVSRALTSGMEEMGRRVAGAYTVNTLGAMAGSLLAGFALIPLLGLKGAAMAGGGLNLLVGIGLLAVSGGRAGSPAILALALYAAAGAWASSVSRDPSLVNFYSAHRHLEGEPFDRIAAGDAAMLTPLYERDTSEGTVRAFRTTDGSLLMQVGGKIEGTTARDRANTLLLAYLPIAAHPDPRSMLVIGLGAGVTLGAAREHLPEVALAEINPGVLEAVGRFGPPGLLEGITVHRGDARNLLLRSDEAWDLISSEPSYPADPGTAGLFTADYYRLAARRLAPGGIYAQWLPYHLLTNDDVDMMLATFASAFPHVSVWKIPDGLDLILLGSREPFVADEAAVRAGVERLNTDRWPLGFVLSRTPEQVREFLGSARPPLNTDDRPRLEFRTSLNLRVGDLALLEQAVPAPAP